MLYHIIDLIIYKSLLIATSSFRRIYHLQFWLHYQDFVIDYVKYLIFGFDLQLITIHNLLADTSYFWSLSSLDLDIKRNLSFFHFRPINAQGKSKNQKQYRLIVSLNLLILNMRI